MANIFSVSNKDELLSALASATGGDTIELAGGDYGALEITPYSGFQGDPNFASSVTITSATPGSPASFSGLNLQDVSNITFDNVKFDHDYSSDPNFRNFLIRDSSDVTIRNSLFEGSDLEGSGTIADGFPIGVALMVRWSSDITLENNEIKTFTTGAQFLETTNINVISNNIHDMRSDGLNFAGVQNVLIEDNHLHDFRTNTATGDHPDMIQFWTTNAELLLTDVTIRDNTFDAGEGGWTQTIFMRNAAAEAAGAGEETFFKNILIEENVISNGHLHGITVGATDGLVIQNNMILSRSQTDESFSSSPTIRVKSESTNVVIEGNAVPGINGYRDQLDWQVFNNMIAQNSSPNATGYYGDLFLASTTDDGISAWMLNPNKDTSEFNGLFSGFSLNETPDTLRPAFNIETTPSKDGSLVFDASHTYGPSGQITGSDAEFVWDFGDGTSAIGQQVQHSYEHAGRYDATLTITLPDNRNFTADAPVALIGEDVLQFDTTTGHFYTEAYGTRAVIEGSDIGSVAVGDGQGIDLDGTGTILRIRRSDVDRFFETDRFTLSMELSADEPGSSGYVTTMWGRYTMEISSSGNVEFNLSTSAENKTLSTTGVTVNDGATHDIVIDFNSLEESLRILVDGEVAAETHISGIMPRVGGNDLAIGAPSWLGPNFNGTLTAFDLNAAASHYPVFSGPAPDTIIGTTGTDTAVYSGSQSSYTLTLSPTATTLIDRRPDGNGMDTLIDMEFLDFDTEIPAMGGNPMNLDQFGGPVALNEEEFADLIALYIAYFNRAPDATGLYFWATAFSNGLTLEEIAARFDTSAETRALYPDDSSNAEFVQAVYNNVLGRDPDQGGFDFWLGHLDSGTIPRDVFISRLLDGAQGTDIDYIKNKVDIGIYFTVIKGMSNGQNGKDVMELFDGSQQSVENAIAAADQFYAAALDPHFGEFLIPLVGVLDNPFAVA